MSHDQPGLHHTSTETTYAPLPTAIHHDPTRRLWLLVSRQSTYALGVTPDNHLVNLHWGPRLAYFQDLADPSFPPNGGSHDPALTAALEEYPAYGGLRFGEITATVFFHDAVRDLDLHYDRAELIAAQTSKDLPTLLIHLRDAFYPLQLTLSYQLDTSNDLIIRSATFVNLGTETIRLDRAFSAAWHLPRQYATRTLFTLAGQWAYENQIQYHPLSSGTTSVESRRGVTSLQASPWFAISTTSPNTSFIPPSPQDETYFGTLAWSGNWLIRVSTDINNATTIAGGLSDHDFAWQLHAGASFTTPDFIAGFAPDGLNGARQRLHHYARDFVLPTPQAHEMRPVLYNSWEATLFSVNEANQTALAERAARIGAELFVVDDGWFVGRQSDNAGLGDWRVDPDKFPHGLAPLVRRVNELGMLFGIWVEPEMVNPDSDLYRAHPDWVYSFPNRQRSEARNQLVLNFGREDVRQNIFDQLDALLSRYPISFLKWDMNRPISEPGWTEYVNQGGDAREIWVRHTQGVYSVLSALRQRHPQLSIESCASGGGRADLGILRYTDQAWTSDNTHPLARLFIQEGFSLVLPARVMEAWVTDAGRGEIPLAFRFHVMMLGALGIGGNLVHWNEDELNEAARWIAIYKNIRPIIQQGDQSWLLSPTATSGELAAVQYTTPSQDEAIVFFLRRSDPFSHKLPPLRLLNLDPTTRYTIKNIQTEADLGPQTSKNSDLSSTLSGQVLMARGLDIPLPSWQSYASCLLYLRRQEP
jgi:alpha-galactosidase